MKHGTIVFTAVAACLAASLLLFARFRDDSAAVVNEERHTAANSAGEEEADVAEYSLEELFFHHDIENGHLLATANGSMGEQLERAAVFVPPGGGDCQTAVKLIFSDDSRIILEEGGAIIEYHLYHFSGDDPLIIKYEPGKTFSLIRYSANEDSFKRAEASEYFAGHVDLSGRFSMGHVSVTDETTGGVYFWEGGRFVTK